MLAKTITSFGRAGLAVLPSIDGMWGGSALKSGAESIVDGSAFRGFRWRELPCVATLLEQSQRFREAATARAAAVTAAERFYLDLLECQWRLDALDSMVAAVREALGDVPFCGSSAAASRPRSPRLVVHAHSGDSDAAASTANGAAALDTTVTGGGAIPSDFGSAPLCNAGAPECPGKGCGLCSTSGAEGACGWALGEEEWKRDALERCLLQIEAQQHAATESLRERAEVYATGVRASSGCIERLAMAEGERQRAGERLERLVADTFAEIIADARGLLTVEAGGGGLRRCCPALERRREFWHGQLEETWAAWHDATGVMHLAGEDAMDAWFAVAEAVREARRVAAEEEVSPKAALVKASAEAAARCLEVEVFNSLGLVGLDIEPSALGAVESAVWLEQDSATGLEGGSRAWPAMRFALLRSVLKELKAEGVPFESELQAPPELLEASPTRSFA